MTTTKNKRKRRFSETIEDTTSFTSISHEPATKRQKRSVRSADSSIKNIKQKQIDGAGITIYYQTADYTQDQISYILSFTKKGVNRPILLFSDNDIDNYWLRLNRNKKGSNRQQIYDKDNNSLLIGKYDNYNKSSFLSVGIITNYILDKSVPLKWNEFTANIDASFQILFELIKKRKVKHIIIPSKHPLSKKNKNEIFHRLDYGLNLTHKHLLYIQSKINKMEQKYATNYKFVDDPLYFNQNMFSKPKNRNKKSKKQSQRHKILKTKKKTVTFQDNVTEIKQKDEREIRLKQEVVKRAKQRSQKKKKPALVRQSTLEYDEAEASVGNESPSPLSKSLEHVLSLQNRSYQQFPESKSKYNHYFKFPLTSKQQETMLTMAQYEPLIKHNYNMSYQQYKSHQEYEKKRQEWHNLFALRRWEQNKVDQVTQIQRAQQIKRESTYINPSLSPSVSLSSMSPFYEFKGRGWRGYINDMDHGYVKIWQTMIIFMVFVMAVLAIWSVFKFIPDDPAKPPFAISEDEVSESQLSQVNFVNFGVVTMLIFMLCFGWIYGNDAHKSPVFWISWMMFIICCYHAVRDIAQYDGHLPAERYDYKQDSYDIVDEFDDDDDYFSNPYYDPVPAPVSRYIHVPKTDDIYSKTDYVMDVNDMDMNDCDVLIFGGNLWVKYGVDIILWLSFACCLSLCFPQKRMIFIVILTISVCIIFCLFRFVENMISSHLKMNHAEIMELCWFYLLSIVIPLVVVSMIIVHIIQCLNMRDNIYYMVNKGILIVIILCAMYYDQTLTIQFMLISGVIYFIFINMTSYANMYRMGYRKSKKHKKQYRKKIHHRQHFNPYSSTNIDEPRRRKKHNSDYWQQQKKKRRYSK